MIPLQSVPGGPIALVALAVVGVILAVIAVRIAIKIAIRVGIVLAVILGALWLLGQAGLPVPVFGMV